MPRIFLIVLAAFLICVGQAAAAGTPGFFPPALEDVLKTTRPPDFCGEAVPFDAPGVRERFEKEFLLILWDRPQVLLWLKRAPRYFPQIEKILAQHHLPQDIKYVAVAESALRPHARSGKNAVGFWQMLKNTGRKYGLRIDRQVDQRRNLTASTVAAVRYFQALKEIFGSWTLAAAAYNMGEDGLQAEILAQKKNLFYRLYLPLETQRFIFRILVIKAIFSDPARFGFKLEKADLYLPLAVAVTEVVCTREIPIQLVAAAAKTDFKHIKDLNPELRGHYLVEGAYHINIPATGARGFVKRFKALSLAFHDSRQKRIYVVKSGDNLSMIAERFEVPLSALIIWNRIDINRPLQPGMRLIVRPEKVAP